jgi:phosphate-selective porin OprO/OprP
MKSPTAAATPYCSSAGASQYDYDATRSQDRGIDTRDFDMRRARIDSRGWVGDWGYKAQFNLAESDQ